MKSLYCKILAFATASVALTILSMMGLTASAQIKTIEKPGGPVFESIVISDDYEVIVKKSGKCGYTITVRDDYEPYCKHYVRNKTLYVSVDKKSMTKEMKKYLSGKDASIPVLKIEVNAPNMKSISLSGKSFLSDETDMKASNGISFELKENSSIKNLSLVADNVSIKASDKSGVFMLLNSKIINVETSGNASAVVELKQRADSLVIKSDKGSKLKSEGEVMHVDVTSGGSSEITLEGKGKTINITGSNSSMVSAVNFECNDAIVSLANYATVDECAEDTLKVQLKGNSKLYFKGKPLFDIVGITGSTLLPYSEKK